MAHSRRRRPVGAGLVTGVATGLLLLSWWWANDRAACRSADVGACVGSALLVAVVGVPVYLLVLWSGLRWAAASRPVVGVLLVLAAGYGALLASEGIDPPSVVWPFVVAVLAGGYVLLEPRVQSG